MHLRSPRPAPTGAALPTHLTLEVTTVCNITPPCVMCGKHIYPQQGWLNRDASHLPERFLPKLQGVLRHLQVLTLQGIGEPLACPDLFKFAAGVPDTCHVQFTSNGWLLHRENRDRILDQRIATVEFSLDASTAATYRKIRHGDFDATIEKIAALIAEREQRQATFPGVILNMCLMRENIDDLPGFVRLAKRLKANHCYGVHLNQGMSWRTGWFDYDRQHCSLDPERHDERVAEAFAISHELGMPFQLKGRTFYRENRPLPVPLVPHLPTPARLRTDGLPSGSKCILPWQQAIVYRDGRVANCCWQRPLGSLEDNSFEEIWHGALQQAVRQQLLTGSFHRYCMGNSVCPPRGRP
jgi:MoaA/NifB/PqqE/SkfB family radical SAM enzyme